MSSRVMNHVIAANQPVTLLRLFYDITSKKYVFFFQPDMSKKRTILSLDQRIKVRCAPSGRITSRRALAAECGKTQMAGLPL